MFKAIRPMKTIARSRVTTLFLLAATILSPSLHGCSTNPATGEQSFTAFMSPEQESRVGREQDPQLKKAFGGVYNDPELAAYVTGIGKKLAAIGNAGSRLYLHGSELTCG